MLSGHSYRRRRGNWGGGYGPGYYSNVLPAYAVVSESGDSCACKSNGTGAVGSLETWVKDNPIISLIGVFALGMLVSSKKKLF